MIHRTKKVKFHSGSDSNKMILRKMMRNFIVNSHIKTSEKRAKILKRYLDIVVSKSKEYSEANKNYLLRYFPDKNIISILFDQVGPAVKDINGGYVRIVRLNKRESDASMRVRLEWAHPVVIDKTPKASKEDEKPEPKKVAKKVVAKKTSKVAEKVKKTK